MTKPRILKRPTPDDISDLVEIYDDIIELLFTKHRDKTGIAAPTLIYILGTCLITKEELCSAIDDLIKVFEKQEQARKGRGKKQNN